MSQYTVTVKQMVENNIDIFNFNYPIFDDNHKQTLEQKIIRHYYFHEIGVETVGRFLFHLETRMNEIMPYFNKLYGVATLEYDTLTNYDLTETTTREIVGESNSTGNDSRNVSGSKTDNSTSVVDDTSKHKNIFSDTPNGRLNLDDNFATSITQNDNLSNVSTTSKIDGVTSQNETFSSNTVGGHTQNETTTLTRKGNIGVMSAQDLIEKELALYKKIGNIDVLVINELRDLFMRVY